MSAEYQRKNVTIRGQRTSISLESSIWSGLEEICEREGMNFNQLCTIIDGSRSGASRTSAVRTFIVNYFRSMANDSKLENIGSLTSLGANIEKLIEEPISVR